MTSTHSPLNESLQLTDKVSIKNRLFKSAMSEQMATRDNAPTSELIHLYRTWAEGGVGVQITGNVMIDRTALGEPKNVVLDKQSELSLFKRWASAGTSNNTHLWMQLNHPGKQIPNILCKSPVAPSAVPLGDELKSMFNPPRALTEAEILDIIERFAWAAKQAKDCGFTGVQIHSAHGYLVNQFLSAHHNRRDDQWGGDLNNRMRFLREIYKAVRQAVGETFPVAVKLNSSDFQKGGFTEAESMQVIKTLEADGINLIEVSGGNYEHTAMMGTEDNSTTSAPVKESTRKREAYFLEFADKASQSLSIPLVVTGGFRSAAAMNEALNSQATSMIGIARPLAVDPLLPNKLLADSEHIIELKQLTTGFPKLDFMTMLDLNWYEQQMARIGKGKRPNPNKSAWGTVLRTVGALGAQAFQRRRA